VPLGVSVEQVSARHFVSARELLSAFSGLLPARPPTPAPSSPGAA
jgi:hypothetical protein